MSVANNIDPSDLEEKLGRRFRIGACLGAGGQGVVYRAERVRTTPRRHRQSEIVALKLYLEPSQTKRVDREVKAMRGLGHPNFARLLDDGEIELGGAPVRWVAWEFIDGEPLDDKLKSGPVSPNIAAAIGRDVAKAVDHLWCQRIVHRDIKPSNIMVRSDGDPAVLIDLGIAKHLSESTLTQVGSTWGTTGYLSPEQNRAESQLTCYSDIFSLGVVLMEALSGAHPTARDQTTLVKFPPKCSAVAPATPVQLAEIIDAMLSLRPTFRPSPQEVRIALSAFLKALPDQPNVLR